jgi:cbb3-type cytochrome oxidase subunit 3
MTYDTVATVSQVTTLLLFLAMFLVVIGYVLWPKNGEKFNKAASVALDLDKNKTIARGER